MAVDLLPLLEGVRSTGRARWIARCPAHEDRSPSLTVAQGERGILLKCWTGCSIGEVTAALGLTVQELFEDYHDHRYRGRRPHLSGREVLSILHLEATVLLMAAQTLAKGEPVDPERVAEAGAKIGRLMREVGCER